MLGRSLAATPGVRPLHFSWRTALLGRYDVFHVHWPEILVDGRSPLKKAVRQVLTVAFLAKLAIRRIPIVRTVHNLERPQGISRRESLLLALMERMTTLRVRVNPVTDIPADQPHATILHGHYRDWFRDEARADQVPGRLGYVGLVRRYKGVEQLVASFRGAGGAGDAGADLSLRIGGKPSTEELADTVRALAAGDDRIRLDLHFLTDAELVEIVTSSELVVLPYRFMHNSGGALAALSLDRPVLVPDNAVNRALAEEAGPGWIHLFDGDLTPEELLRAAEAVRTGARASSPELSGRDWDRAGTAHASAYRRALRIRRGLERG
ncbi:glycosyl transferase [Clavibacter michiganensis]|uniref:glycosyl transferase n=1 Tax=Clavibacter michiganensis TaxID=28447 RepID=UPI002157E883|nr:glycosyl transferase [Clavibacter michiganensis]